MKTIIAGGRELTDESLVEETITDRVPWDISEVVEGGQRGIDRIARKWANENNIPVETFEADWDQYGSAAGPIRNEEMAEYADALVAIRDGPSSGTQNMVKLAERYDLRIVERDISSADLFSFESSDNTE
jgi:hypothetical protein